MDYQYPEPRLHPADQDLRDIRRRAERLPNDLPCRHNEASEDCVLYRINKSLKTENVGILCVEAIEHHNYKQRVRTTVFYDLLFMPCFANRTHVPHVPNCRSTKEFRAAIIGRISGGTVSGTLDGVTMRGNHGFRFCRNHEAYDKRVPTTDGWVHLKKVDNVGNRELYMARFLKPICHVCEGQ